MTLPRHSLTALQIADVALTVAFLRCGVPEANPVAAWALALGWAGVTAVLAVKLAVAVLAHFHLRPSLRRVATGMYVCVVGTNCAALAVAWRAS